MMQQRAISPDADLVPLLAALCRLAVADAHDGVAAEPDEMPAALFLTASGLAERAGVAPVATERLERFRQVVQTRMF